MHQVGNKMWKPAHHSLALYFYYECTRRAKHADVNKTSEPLACPSTYNLILLLARIILQHESAASCSDYSLKSQFVGFSGSLYSSLAYSKYRRNM